MKPTTIFAIILLGDMHLVSFAENLSAGFSFEEFTPFGNDLSWSVSITNDSQQVKNCEVSFVVTSLQYNGRPMGEVSSVVSTSVIAAVSSDVVSFAVPSSVYSSFSRDSKTFECIASVTDLSDEDEWITERMRAFVTFETPLSIFVYPPIMPTMGETVVAGCCWTNTTNVPLSASFSMSSSGGLETEDGDDMPEWPPLLVVPGQSVSVSTSLVVRTTGAPTLTFFLQTDKTPVASATWESN